MATTFTGLLDREPIVGVLPEFWWHDETRPGFTLVLDQDVQDQINTGNCDWTAMADSLGAQAIGAAA